MRNARRAIISIVLLTAPFQGVLGIDLPFAKAIRECFAGRARMAAERNSPSRFNPKKIDTSKTERLSRYAYRVEVEGESPVVVRLPGINSDTKRERFAAAFLQGVPSLETPPVTVLNPATTRAVMKKIRKSHPEDVDDLVKSWKDYKLGIGPGNASATYAPFLPYRIGNEVLAEMHVGGGVRDKIVHLGRMTSKNIASVRKPTTEELLQSWERATPEIKEVLVKDLKSIWPQSNSVKPDDYMDYLIENMDFWNSNEAGQLMVRGLERIDPELQSELADYWITYSILGIPDFHPHNWVFDGNRPIGIDLAHPVDLGEVRPDPLDLIGHQHPLGNHAMMPEISELLVAAVSPEVRTYLEGMDDFRIAQIAQQNGYDISHEEVSEIMARIERFKAYLE